MSTRPSRAWRSGPDVTERIAELEKKLLAQSKTIEVLMDAVDMRQQQRGSAFVLLEENAALEKMVRRKTRELEAAVAELRRTQAKLLGAQKLEAIGQLAAGIAHEINTPTQYVSDNVTFLLRALRGMTEALTAYRGLADAVRGSHAADEQLAGAETICKKVKLDYLLKQVPRAIEQSLEGLGRVTSIVGAMKDFSHPSQGQKTLTDLHESLQTTLTVARNEWKYIAEVVTDFDVNLGPVPCLRDEINQVFLNLIVNAAHAISDVTNGGASGKGTITITTRVDNDFAEIRIGDTGAGIPEKIRSRIFEPFFTTKEVGKGTGQGLAIARSIVVDKHRGAIRFESKPGEGATFILRLPLTATVQAQAVPGQR